MSCLLELIASLSSLLLRLSMQLKDALVSQTLPQRCKNIVPSIHPKPLPHSTRFRRPKISQVHPLAHCCTSAGVNDLLVSWSGTFSTLPIVLERDLILAPAMRQYGIRWRRLVINEFVQFERVGIDEPHMWLR